MIVADCRGTFQRAGDHPWHGILCQRHPVPDYPQTFEERQDVIESPARISLGCPIIIILSIAAYVHHAVHYRGASQDLAAGPIASLLHGGQASHTLRLCIVTIVNVAADEVQKHGRNLSAYWFVST